MKTSKLALAVALATMTAAASTATFAHEQGDLVLRAGPVNVDPDSSSSVLSLGGAELPGTGVTVDDNTQLGLTATWMFGENIGLGVLAATPFQHDIIESGLGVGRVGSTRHLPPTVTLQYFPMDSSSKFQPFVGVGVNYTTFFSEEVDPTLEGVLGGESSMSLDDSFGLAFELGVDYAINDKWGLNASLWMIDIDTDAVINSPAGDVTVDVEIDPTVLMFGATYKW